MQQHKQQLQQHELIGRYYLEHYPYTLMHKWLQAAAGVREFGDRKEQREFIFVTKDNRWIRYLCFGTATEWHRQASELTNSVVSRMEVGGTFSTLPAVDKQLIQSLGLKPSACELRFDVDIDDYQELRKDYCSCAAKEICAVCWTFLACAVETLEYMLREYFGFQHILFVFSGRRGVHCWVCDPCVQYLTAKERERIHAVLSQVLVAENLQDTSSSARGGSGISISISSIKKKKKQQPLTLAGHVNHLLEQVFWKGYKLLKRQQETRDKPAFQTSLPDCASRLNVQQKISVAQTMRLRLDSKVTCDPSHPMKLPFCVHPSTGYVAIPIDPTRVYDFRLSEVPCVLPKQHQQQQYSFEEALQEHFSAFRALFFDNFYDSVVLPSETSSDSDEYEEDDNSCSSSSSNSSNPA